MNFFDTSCLTTEDRKLVVEIIKQIKAEEKEEVKNMMNSSKQPSHVLSRPTPQKFSSRNTQIPKIPRR